MHWWGQGSEFRTACLTALLLAHRLAEQADMIGAVALDAFDAKTEPFNPLVHQVRPFGGQALVAQRIREWRSGSAIAEAHKPYVQDPYSFRCIPQVHGASWDVLQHVTQVFETEINSVTDNPLIFPDEDEILSGGNFHGQPLALALDYLKLGMAEYGSISERRTYQLICGFRGFYTDSSMLDVFDDAVQVKQPADNIAPFLFFGRYSCRCVSWALDGLF